VSRRTLDPKSVNDIVKHRAGLAGLEAGDFSAHGLRSGYLTEAANRGIPLPEAMEQSRHRFGAAGVQLLQQRDPAQRVARRQRQQLSVRPIRHRGAPTKR
jgi:integrase